VDGVRTQYTQIRETITALRREIATSDPEGLDIADLRRRTEHLAAALRNQRSRESDLIYEAYYDAYSTDLESDVQRST